MKKAKKTKKEKALRYNKGKAPVDLIPGFVLKSIAEVYAKGAMKYPTYNWYGGFNTSELMGCMERHLQELKDGKDFDIGDTECLHAAQIAWNAIAFIVQYHTGKGIDDRVKKFRKGEKEANLKLLKEKVYHIDIELPDFDRYEVARKAHLKGKKK